MHLSIPRCWSACGNSLGLVSFGFLNRLDCEPIWDLFWKSHGMNFDTGNSIFHSMIDMFADLSCLFSRNSSIRSCLIEDFQASNHFLYTLFLWWFNCLRSTGHCQLNTSHRRTQSPRATIWQDGVWLKKHNPLQQVNRKKRHLDLIHLDRPQLASTKWPVEKS